MQSDIIAIAIAYILGLAARAVGLPPLVGYLLAGFAEHVCHELLPEPSQPVL